MESRNPTRRSPSPRWLVPSLSLLAWSIAVACSSGGSSGSAANTSTDSGNTAATPGEALCLAIQDRASECASQTPCEAALVADCAKLVDLVSADFSVETRTCIQTGGSPTSCLSKSLGGLTPTPGQKQFATTFCSSCAGGLVPGCEELFFAQGDTVPEQLQVAGKLILPLSDDLVGHLETECAQANPLTCVANFATCAQGVLAKQALPTETAQCLLDAIISGGSSQPPSECGDPDAGTGGSDGGGAGTGGAAGAGGSAGSSGTCTKYTGSCETFQVGSVACNTCMQSNCCAPIQACLDDEHCGGLVVCASDNCSGAADLGACMNQSCGPCLDATSADLAAAIGECLESSCNAECS